MGRYVFILFMMMCSAGYADVTPCPDSAYSDYYVVNAENDYNFVLNNSTFIESMDSGCPSGYSGVDVPGGIRIYPILVGETLCGNNRLSNGECSPYPTEECDSGYNTTYNTATFRVSMDGDCPWSGYSGFDVDNRQIVWMNDSGGLLCPSGQYLNNGECSDFGPCENEYYTANEYYAIPTGATTFVELSAGVCPSGYSQYMTGAECTEMDDSVCPIVCNPTADYMYTDVGSCAYKCVDNDKWRHLHFGTSSVKLWLDKTITPSIAISIPVNDGTQICYGNLMRDRAANTLNVKYGNQIYHTVN